MNRLLLIFCLLLPYFAQTQDVYIVKNSNINNVHEVYLLNLSPDTSYVFQFEFQPITGCNDIAIAPDGKFYGVDDERIYEISPTEGTVTTVQAIPLTGAYTTLVCSNEYELYTLNTGGYLYKHDLLSGNFEPIAQLPYGSPGDLTFYKGNLVFQSSFDGHIKAFNLENQSLVTIFCMPHPLDVSGQSFFGISNTSDECESLSLVASSVNNDLYEIDIENNSITHLKVSNPFLILKSIILGMASSVEHFSSACSFQFTDVECPPKDTSTFFILGRTETENVFHVYSLNADQSISFKYEFYSEYGCSDVAFTNSGFLYGIGTELPNSIFKINSISGEVQKLIEFPTNKKTRSFCCGRSK